jgi:hypothetical protein
MRTATMHKTADQHATWKYIEWIDIYPGVGSFVSPTMSDFEVHGETVNALNWLHAEHTWAKRKLRETAERHGCDQDDWGRCHHCHANIRYGVIFRDHAGDHYMIGQDCAQYIQSGLDRGPWLLKAKLSQLKKIETKNGTRFVLGLEVPRWYWELDRQLRPRFCSLSKYEKPGRRGKQVVWSLSIWGGSPDEVFRGYDELKKLESAHAH